MLSYNGGDGLLSLWNMSSATLCLLQVVLVTVLYHSNQEVTNTGRDRRADQVARWRLPSQVLGSGKDPWPRTLGLRRAQQPALPFHSVALGGES